MSSKVTMHNKMIVSNKKSPMNCKVHKQTRWWQAPRHTQKKKEKEANEQNNQKKHKEKMWIWRSAWAIRRGNVSLPIVQHSGAPALNPDANST